MSRQYYLYSIKIQTSIRNTIFFYGVDETNNKMKSRVYKVQYSDRNNVALLKLDEDLCFDSRCEEYNIFVDKYKQPVSYSLIHIVVTNPLR